MKELTDEDRKAIKDAIGQQLDRATHVTYEINRDPMRDTEAEELAADGFQRHKPGPLVTIKLDLWVQTS